MTTRFASCLTLFFLSWMLISPSYAVIFSPGNIVEKTSEEMDAEVQLYPLAPLNQEGYLDVSAGHRIYFAEYGNPNGQPAVYLHGGPGSGSDPSVTKFFDPNHYRIIIFDQRGAGKSIPHAEMKGNTTQDLISDMEQLRRHLNINKWLVTGGSWGSALALLYGQAHPEVVTGFVLRGIFTGTKEEADNLYFGMAKTFPEIWHEFVSYLPADERTDLKAAYYKRVMDPDPKVHQPASFAFVKYDALCGALFRPDLDTKLDNDKFVLSISRGFMYYSANNFFIKENQIIDNIHKVKDIPALIVHGRYDTICPAQNAYKLFEAWPNAALTYVRDAGHFANEKGISLALVAASDSFKTNEFNNHG